MSNEWTRAQINILKAMRDAGHDFEEISEATGHTPASCRTKIYSEKVLKYANHEIYASKNGRPMAKPPVMRPCITCKKLFKSWDAAKNQRCSACAARSEYSFN